MQPNRRTFLRSLIGRPYEAGGEGPSFDCYGLARHVLRDLYGVALPQNRRSPISRRAWRRVAAPEDGAIVLMGQGDTHIGVYVAGGVIHALDGVGVVFDDFLSLRFRGFGNLRIYRPA